MSKVTRKQKNTNKRNSQQPDSNKMELFDSHIQQPTWTSDKAETVQTQYASN